MNDHFELLSNYSSYSLPSLPAFDVIPGIPPIDNRENVDTSSIIDIDSYRNMSPTSYLSNIDLFIDNKEFFFQAQDHSYENIDRITNYPYIIILSNAVENFRNIFKEFNKNKNQNNKLIAADINNILSIIEKLEDRKHKIKYDISMLLENNIDTINKKKKIVEKLDNKMNKLYDKM